MKQIDLHDVVSTGDFTSCRRDELSIMWALTKVCNHKCSYCVYHKSAQGAEYSSREDLLRGARKLLHLGRPHYQITLYGGEPTLHPAFLDLLEYFGANSAPVSLRVFTNGSRSAAFFERMAPIAKKSPLLSIFSLHHEFVDFPRFKRAIEITAGADLSVGIGILFLARFKEQSRRYIDELFELRERVPFFVNISHPYNVEGIMGRGCTEEDLEWIKACQQAFDDRPPPSHLTSPFFCRVLSATTLKSADKRITLLPEESAQFLSRLQRPSYTDFYCCSGANVMFIEEDGAVRGGVCSSSIPMGNIFNDSDLSLVQAMDVVRCAATACTAIENIPLPKFRDQAEAEACMAAFKGRAKGHFYRAEANRLAI